jgi:hypothetical protein
MKQIALFCFALLLTLGNWSCNAQANKKEEANTTVATKVEVYYFHFTRRCATCLSVEENAKKAVESLYADKVKKGEYSFKGINLDDDSSKSIAEKLGIGGQTLLVVCGDKKIDITDKGFMNAYDLEKMKEEIKKAVELALKG